MKDRESKEYILGPVSENEKQWNYILFSFLHFSRSHTFQTFEESITQLLALSDTISYKELPLRLYQIGIKFRDEMTPRYGLMRAREFLMKDMYTFDADIESARRTYGEVSEIYEKLLHKISVPFVKGLAFFLHLFPFKY